MENQVRRVSIEIDEYMAKRILNLSREGSFGGGFKNSSLDSVVRYLLTKSVMAAERKIARIEKAKQKEAHIKSLRRSIENIKEAIQIAKDRKHKKTSLVQTPNQYKENRYGCRQRYGL
jgi:hypothetical protein